MSLAKKPFVVLDAELLSSSVWAEAAHVRLVWITLLILCDTEGYVGAALPGIASAAGVTLEEAESALEKLQQPDKYSRTQAHEGRRVAVVERGFQVLNFLEHLDRLSSERAKARDRVWRSRQRAKARKDPPIDETPGDDTASTQHRQSSQGEGSSEQGEGNRDSTDTTNNVNGLAAVGRDAELVAIAEVVPDRPQRIPQKTSAEKACKVLVELWNGLFGTRLRTEGTTYDELVRNFVRRCQGGQARGQEWAPCQPGEILEAAVIAYCTGREFWRKQSPEVLLRTGAFGKTSGNGATTGGTNHVRELLTKPQTQTVALPASAVGVVVAMGIASELQALGVVVPSEGAA